MLNLFSKCNFIEKVMDKWLDSGDLLPYDDQVGGHKFTKEKPLLGLYNDINQIYPSIPI